MLPAFLTTVLFAISAVCANRTTRLLGGVEANFWRISLATLLLGIWAHTLGQGLSGAAFGYFLLSGCVGFGIGDSALYQALPKLGSRLSIMLVHCLAAPFAALIEWLWLGNTLAPRQIVCGATILAGVALALAPGASGDLTRRISGLGIFYGTLAAFGQGFGAVLSRKAYRVAEGAGQSIDGLTAAYQRILAGWAVAAFFFFFLRWKEQAAGSSASAASLAPDGKGRKAAPWILVNAIAGPTLGVACYQWALSRWETGVVLPVVAMTPLVIIPLAMLLENERPAFLSLLGGVIAVIGASALVM